MSFKEAISHGIISDYKILTVPVSEDRFARLIAENRLLNLHARSDEAEARTVATGVALKTGSESTESNTRSRSIPASWLQIASASSRMCSTACGRELLTPTSQAK